MSSSQLIPLVVELPWFKVNAFAFLPKDKKTVKSQWAIFTHGYTSHKGDCLNWASRLVDVGVPTIIFDQPGHYLGSFHELNSWEDFKHHAHELFEASYLKLQDLMRDIHHHDKPQTLILGGHSLGAYTAIQATSCFPHQEKIVMAIGIGIGQRQATHLFETAFYQKTLDIRRQLVSPHLDSKIVFSWLKHEKENLNISHQRIHLITGKDDVVVGGGGLRAFVDVLEKNENHVTWDEPHRLAHHEPAMATAHLHAFLKNHFSW